MFLFWMLIANLVPDCQPDIKPPTTSVWGITQFIVIYMCQYTNKT